MKQEALKPAEALKHIRALVLAALETEDPALLRKHLVMIDEVASKGQPDGKEG